MADPNLRGAGEAVLANPTLRGRFCWYDLMTPDAKKAEAFYTTAVGWGTQVWENGPMSYTLWTADGNPIGGIMPMPANAGAPPHWLAYIGTPDTDATLKEAESRGAKTLVKATDIPTVGRYAVLSDPQGAAFALFTPEKTPTQPEEPAKRGEFSWHELATTDIDAALRFYKALFGWEMLADHDMGPMGIYRIIGRNGVRLGGMYNKPADMPVPPNWLQYVLVDSAASAVDRVKAGGGTVINGPMEVPGGDWIAQCLDPQGGPFAVQSKSK